MKTQDRGDNYTKVLRRGEPWTAGGTSLPLKEEKTGAERYMFKFV